MNINSLYFDFRFQPPASPPLRENRLPNSISLPDLNEIRESMHHFAIALNVRTDLLDADLQNGIANALRENLVELPSDHPFKNSRLIVFKDTYRGIVPVNGIRESELLAITQMYLEITNNKTVIQIQGNSEFNSIVHDCIKSWMITELGREGLKDLLLNHAGKILTIRPTTPTFPNTITKWGKTTESAEIFFDPFEQDLIFCQSKFKGEKELMQSPLYLNLWHELEHGRQIFRSNSLEEYIAFRSRPLTLGPEYQNYSEQSVIMPHVNLPPFPNSMEEVENIPWSPPQPYPQGRTFTENDLRSVMGLPPRIGHRGVSLPPKHFDISNADSINYFVDLCHTGCVKEVREILTETKLDLNFIDEDDPRSMPPLLIAAKGNQPEMVKLLLEFGAHPDYVTPKGLSLAHYVIKSGNVQWLDELCQAKIVDLKAADKTGTALIYYAIITMSHNSTEMIQYLLSQGVSPFSKCADKSCALHGAAQAGNINLFNHLVGLGLNVNALNSEGLKPVQIAMQYGKIELVKQLCPTIQDYYQLTPCGKSLMHFAAESANSHAVRFLLELETNNQANPTIPFNFMTKFDNSGYSPMNYAFQNAQYESGQNFIRFMLMSGFDLLPDQLPDFVTLFATAKSPIREEMLDRVFIIPDLINSLLCNKTTLLHFAIQEEDCELARYALSRGANSNVLILNPTVTSLLHLTIEKQHPILTKLLLNAGADLMQPNYNGVTPKQLLLSKFMKKHFIDMELFKMIFRATDAVINSLKRRIHPVDSGELS